MSVRLETTGRTCVAALLLVSAVTLGAGPARADTGVSLLHVARTLGFSYRYLQYENAVELIRPGGIVVVRPGDPFFTINGRTEPVNGMAPEYRDNDVYVSRAFLREIRGAGSPYRYTGAGREFGVAHAPVAGNVTELALGQTPATNVIDVSGVATPGAVVTIVLKSALSEDLPLTVIDSVETTADAGGRFATSISTEPVHFAPAQYVVEASSPSDVKPVVRVLVPQQRNPAHRTEADRGI